MRELAAMAGLVLAPLWLFQLRANLVAILGAGWRVPDLVALGVAFAALRLPRAWAVGFALCAGLLTDVCDGPRFGAAALRDTLLVSALWPLRKVFYFETRASLFAILLAFVGIQKLTDGLLLAPGAGWRELGCWGPSMLAVTLATAAWGVALAPGFDAILSQSEEEER